MVVWPDSWPPNFVTRLFYKPFELILLEETKRSQIGVRTLVSESSLFGIRPVEGVKNPLHIELVGQYVG